MTTDANSLSSLPSSRDRRFFDLAVASLCSHAAYDYGTFGFWGAYLGEVGTTPRVVVAADRFGVAEHQVVTQIKAADMPGWHFIPAFPEEEEK